MKKLITVCLILPAVLYGSSTTFAQSELGLMALGGELGLVNPDGPIGETISLGAVVHLGKITRDLTLMARLGYWSKSEGPRSLRDFQIGGTVVYELERQVEQLYPYVGGGLSLHFLKEKIARLTNEFSDTKLGIDLLGGAKYKFSKQIDFTGEIMLILGDAEQFHIKVGAIFKLSQ